MLRVAITGGIGTGKTSVLNRLRALGVPVIEADEVAHQVIAPGTDGADRVRRRFGAEIFRSDGQVDRALLGTLVFGDARSRRDLEAIVHPAVYREIMSWFATLERAGERLGAAEIPLLFETGRQGDFDRVVVTSCDPAEQIRRVRARTGLGEAEAIGRIAAQMPVAEKVRLAHYVIETDGTLADTERRTDQVLELLSQAAA